MLSIQDNLTQKTSKDTPHDSQKNKPVSFLESYLKWLLLTLISEKKKYC